MGCTKFSKYLVEYHKDTSTIECIWKNQRRTFREIFCYAISIIYTDSEPRTYLIEAKNFIEVIIKKSLVKISDLIFLLRKQRSFNIENFLEYFVAHPNVNEVTLIKIIRSRKLILVAKGYDNWIDWPLRVLAKKLLQRLDKKYNYQQLIPCGINRNRFIAEYVLSWAFEEDKLSKKGILTFQTQFPKKYQMLVDIKKQASLLNPLKENLFS